MIILSSLRQFGTEITDDPHRRPGCLELIKARDTNFVKIINPENLHLIQLLKNQLHEGGS